MGAREAAREVGFAGGVPSPAARKLYEAVELVDASGADAGWLEQRIEARKEKLAGLERMKRAAELMEVA